MAQNKTTEVNSIVARCRRIEWPVEVSTGNQDWIYRIQCPSGKRVQIHSSPSDRNWIKAVMRQLNAEGFEEAEAEWLAAYDKKRRATIEADRKRSEQKAERLAAREAAVVRAAGPYGLGPVDPAWLLTPTDRPETRIVLMDPDTARKVLETVNTANRQKRDRRTEEFVQIIEDGDFAATHQGIAMDWNGVLQDGQHRLDAVVETGKTVPIMVTVGMDPKHFGKIDTPLLRTARDGAWMRGETNVRVLTGAALMLVKLDKFGTEAHSRRQKISIDLIDRKLEEGGEELRRCVALAAKIRREIKLNSTALAVGAYQITTMLPADDPRPTEFFDRIETGVGCVKGDAVYNLRRLIIRTSDIRGRSMNGWLTLAYLTKTWNHHVRGARVALVWRTNERFPTPLLPPPPGAADDDIYAEAG